MNIPKKIYLQVNPDNEDNIEDIDEITWCEDRINDNDIEYIRSNNEKRN